MQLIKLLRGKKATWHPSKTKIREGDVLLVHGNVDRLIALKDEYGLEMQADVTMTDRELSSDKIKLIEALIPPRSSLLGRTLRRVDFVRRYGCVVLAVLLAPIALSLAAAMKVNPRPYLVAITFAASTSFATPIGYQTNTMIYAPGGYRFFDYTRVGGPLNFLFWGVAVLVIPLLWPF